MDAGLRRHDELLLPRNTTDFNPNKGETVTNHDHGF
jgi:hypothetical protein